jgi:hypothetical protein
MQDALPLARTSHDKEHVMGNAPRSTRDFRHSVLYAWKDPRVRGIGFQAAALREMELNADQPLPYGPLIPDALADGTIPAASLTADLKLTAAKWNDVNNEEDYIFLYVDGQPIEPTDGMPLKDQPDPIEMVIPLAALTALAEGPHTVHFLMGSGFGDGYVSLETSFIIDRTPPGGDELPIIRFKLDYEQNGVTIYQIQADGDLLEASIATYESQAAGDVIKTFIQRQIAGSQTAGPVLTVATTTERHEFAFTLAQLQAASANDRVDFWYTVEDKAGNVTTAARSELRMLVTEAPTQLVAPRVPLFSDDDLVNEQDGRTPITVEIPEFGYARAGDQIRLMLSPGNSYLVSPPLTSADLPVDDDNPDTDNTIRTIDIPYPILRLLSAQSVFTFPCSYIVERGTFKVPSPALDVDVDLTLAGGPDPDPETPGHEDYLPPVVAHSGTGAVDNLIPVGYLPPVFATIVHNSVDGDEVFETDDLVQLYRYDTDGTTAIKVGPETAATAGADLVIDLPAADVVAGIWDFFYEVGRELDTGQTNWALSPTQEVTIEDGTDQPGGPDLMPEAKFRNSDIKQGVAAIGYTRAQAHGGTIVRVYTYLNIAVGDVIELTWQGHDSIRGTGNDIPEAVQDLTHTLVAGDLVPKDDRLDDDPARPPTPVPMVFVDFLVSYAEMQKVVSPEGNKAFGSAWVTYTVTSASGKKNASKDDRDVLRRLAIDARDPAGP